MQGGAADVLRGFGSRGSGGRLGRFTEDKELDESADEEDYRDLSQYEPLSKGES